MQNTILAQHLYGDCQLYKKPGRLQGMHFYPGCIAYILRVYPAPKWHPQLPRMLVEKKGEKPLPDRALQLQYLTGRSQEAHGSS